MFALVLVIALLVITVALAQRLELLADVSLLAGASLLGGLALLAVHPDLDWVAAERVDDGTCSASEIPVVAPVVERVSVQEARELLEVGAATFVDARASAHYVAAHIPGAVSLPADDAESLLDMQSLPIPPQGQVITYCEGGSCEQSEDLGLVLRERDVCQQVRVLDGGWLAWEAAGAPMVQGDTPYGDAPGASVAPEVAG